MTQLYEERVVKAIQDGNLNELRKCWISQSDINRPLSFFKNYKVINKSKVYPFPEIKYPTLVVFAILCEQPDILLYLLIEKSADLSIKVNGWAPIHYAACTKDYFCMKTLLKFQYIQENIDMPVTEPFQVLEGRQTTALHISVTNRRYAQTILLTQELPPIEYNGENERINDIEEAGQYQSANIYAMSAFGSLPIHIAVRQNDLDLCRILLAVNDDLSVVNDKNQTPLDIALQFKRNQLYQQLQLVESVEISPLITKYLPGYEENDNTQQYNQTNKVVGENYDNENVGGNDNGDNETIADLKNQIIDLSQTVEILQNKLATYEHFAPDAPKETQAKMPAYRCSKCGASTDLICPVCNQSFCSVCMPKHIIEH